MQKHRGTIIKIVITIIGLAYAFSEIDFGEAISKMAGARLSGILIVLLLFNISLVVRAARWWLLLRGLGAKLPLGRLVAYYFSGNFFNLFLPSGFGGDVVRVVEAARSVPAATAAGTVLVDRLTGLMTLFAMAFVTLPFRPQTFPDWLALTVAGISLAGLIAGISLLTPNFVNSLDRWLPSKVSPLQYKPAAGFLQAVQGCGKQAIWGAMAISLLFNLMLIGWWAIAGNSLGHQVSLFYYFLVVPIMSVALLMPSIGGLGVRETLAPALFAGAQLSKTDAVTLSLLIFTLTRLSGLLGAPVYFALTLQNRRIKRGD